MAGHNKWSKVKRLKAVTDDVITTDQGYEVRCNLHAFDQVAHALEKAGRSPASSELAYIPTSTVPVTDAAKDRAVGQLHDTLEELDDVQAVFSNEEMDEAGRDHPHV